MWLIANQTPYAADCGWLRDGAGNQRWLVVVKAAFDIQPNGRCRLAAKNDPVRQIAQPYGEFGKSSLQYESDLSALKPATDILVRGDAIVPRGRRARSVDVALRIGGLHKRLRVNGDRCWERHVFGLKIPDPEPFERMAITYERAYGGWDRSSSDPNDHRLDDRNPVGTGFANRAENCEGMRLPNVEHPGHLISSWKDRPAPAGFNVVDCAWSPRRQLAGTYDEQWRKTRFPLWAADFDPRYGNCAPADQQAEGFLEGGEHVEVRGMSESGVLAFDIPKLKLAFRTRFGTKRVDHEGQLCTVTIEPNSARLVLAWQASLVCNRHADDLDETLVVEKRAA